MKLHGLEIFTKLTCALAIIKFELNQRTYLKLRFTHTDEGHYEFFVLPFELTNAPSTFKSLMNDVFQPLMRKFVLIFFDDILVCSRNFSNQLSHLKTIFEVLCAHSFCNGV